MTAAERMRRMRARRKATGYKSVTAWVRRTPTDSQALYSSHRRLDARSLAMHALIAEKIRTDPQLVDVARNNLERWSARWPNKAPAWFEEWRQILRWQWPRIAALLTEQSEHAIRLRQSSPFAGVLNAEERKRIYEAFRTRARDSSRGLDR
jgi:hypothetical protein